MEYAKDVLEIAEEEVGYLEKATLANLDSETGNAGDNNFTKYWRDMAPSYQGQPWCNCFVNWCFVQAYGPVIAKELLCTDSQWSYYTPTSAEFFQKKDQWSSRPQVGSIIFFKNNIRIHHVGIVYKVSSTMVYTIEGNTSSGSAVIPNGGGVYKKSYKIGNTNIAGYGIPNYGEEKVTIVDENVESDRKGLLVLSELNVRETPVNGKVIDTYKKGQRVQISAKAKGSDGAYWFKTAKGYISSKYVEGWIRESNDLWWYIKKNYTYPAGVVETIDGEDYAFDKQGWLIMADRISSTGTIKQI